MFKTIFHETCHTYHIQTLAEHKVNRIKDETDIIKINASESVSET